MKAEQLCTEGVSFSHQRESPCPQTVLTSNCTHPNMTTQHCPLSYFGQLHFVCWQQANWMIRELSGLCRGHFPPQTFGCSEACYTFRKINRNSTVTHLYSHSIHLTRLTLPWRASLEGPGGTLSLRDIKIGPFCFSFVAQRGRRDGHFLDVNYFTRLSVHPLPLHTYTPTLTLECVLHSWEDVPERTWQGFGEGPAAFT